MSDSRLRISLEAAKDNFIKRGLFDCAFTAEATLLKNVKDFIALLGPDIYTARQEARSVAGVPDTFYCYNGRFIALEFKDNVGKPTPQQRKHITRIINAGGQSRVIRTISEVYAVLLDCLENI